MSCDTSEVLLSDRSTPLKDNDILSPHEAEEPHSNDTKECSSTTLLDQDVAVASSSCAEELVQDTDFNKNHSTDEENNYPSAKKLNDEIEEMFAASSVKPALVQHQVSLENGSMAEEEDTTSQSSDTTTSSTTSCSTSSSSSGPPFDLCQAGNDELEMVIEHAIVETHHPAEVPCNEAPPDIERCSSSSNDTINGGDQQEVMTTSAVVEEELNSSLVGERKSPPLAHARDSVNQLADFDEILVLDIPPDSPTNEVGDSQKGWFSAPITINFYIFQYQIPIIGF